MLPFFVSRSYKDPLGIRASCSVEWMTAFASEALVSTI